jgi:uncharacterized membrane protein YukC
MFIIILVFIKEIRNIISSSLDYSNEEFNADYKKGMANLKEGNTEDNEGDDQGDDQGDEGNNQDDNQGDDQGDEGNNQDDDQGDGDGDREQGPKNKGKGRATIEQEEE